MAKPKKKQTHFKRRHVVIILLLFLAIGGYGFIRANHNLRLPVKPLSRRVLDLAVTQIKANKPPPTQAALEYAYVATVYAKTLHANGQSGAVYAAGTMLKTLYPSASTSIDSGLQDLQKQYRLKALAAKDKTNVEPIISEFQHRYQTDGHTLVWDGVVPVGQGKWTLGPKNPFTPMAGDWQRWNVTVPITVPPPPAYGSVQDQEELQIVTQAVASRNGDDVNKINFWGGTPGTETPAGIWQKQLYETVKTELPGNSLQADKAYAVVQQNLAQTISDAFMECWKVKFIYWTARPDMRIPGLKTAMPDPVFPSYISGHSTISKAAADVLSIMVPAHATAWEAMAVEARDSRLKAGIHFQIDNSVGFEVGASVGQQEATNLKLSTQW